MICQQLKQNIFWKQIKYNFRCSLILALNIYRHCQRNFNFYREATILTYYLHCLWKHEKQFLFLTLAAHAKNMHYSAPCFPPPHEPWQNSPPSAFCYPKNCCRVDNRNVIQASSQLLFTCLKDIQLCDASLVWAVKICYLPTLLPFLKIGSELYSLSFITCS